jgi:hypothetical protein
MLVRALPGHGPSVRGEKARCVDRHANVLASGAAGSFLPILTVTPSPVASGSRPGVGRVLLAGGPPRPGTQGRLNLPRVRAGPEFQEGLPRGGVQADSRPDAVAAEVALQPPARAQGTGIARRSQTAVTCRGSSKVPFRRIRASRRRGPGVTANLMLMPCQTLPGGDGRATLPLPLPLPGPFSRRKVSNPLRAVVASGPPPVVRVGCLFPARHGACTSPLWQQKRRGRRWTPS